MLVLACALWCVMYCHVVAKQVMGHRCTARQNLSVTVENMKEQCITVCDIFIVDIKMKYSVHSSVTGSENHLINACLSET